MELFWGIVWAIYFYILGPLISVLCLQLGTFNYYFIYTWNQYNDTSQLLSLRIIPRNEKGLLHIHPGKEGPVLGIQILLATRTAAMIRGMDGRDYRLRILRVQVRAPVLRP